MSSEKWRKQNGVLLHRWHLPGKSFNIRTHGTGSEIRFCSSSFLTALSQIQLIVLCADSRDSQCTIFQWKALLWDFYSKS